MNVEEIVNIVKEFIENPLTSDKVLKFEDTIKFEKNKFDEFIENIMKEIDIQRKDIIKSINYIELLKNQVLDTIFGKYEFLNRIIFKFKKEQDEIILTEIALIKSFRKVY